MTLVALFRSCLRKEYRDQVIKMLRAVPGEYTRTAYRFQWIDDSLKNLLDGGEPFEAVAFLVDQASEQAFPCRKLTLVEPPIRDERIGVYRFVFEIGQYVDVPQSFDSQLSHWGTANASLPPAKFVTPYADNWNEFAELSYSDSSQMWKRSIDFLTHSWNTFDNTVFFRPHSDQYVGKPHGPICKVRQSENAIFSFSSYNPHLNDSDLSGRRLHASVGTVIGDIQQLPPLSRDGHFDLVMKFLEAGTGTLQVEVRPDEQFSSYVPLTVSVSPDSLLDPSGPRVLGPEWQRFLSDVVRKSEQDRSGSSELLDQLAEVFAGDPELMVQRGRLHLNAGEYAAALDEFAKALALHSDSRAVWWSLIAEIRLNHREAVENLLNRVNHSSIESNATLFEDLVQEMHTVPDRTIDWLAELPGLVMSEDKALRILLAMVTDKRDEFSTTAIFFSISNISPQIALQQARASLNLHPDWYSLRREVAKLAFSSGSDELAEDEAEILVHYVGQDAKEYFELVMSLRPLIHAQRFPALLRANAIKLAGSDDDDDTVSISRQMAYLAADYATNNGDLIEAQLALQFLEMQISDSEYARHEYREPIKQVVDKITKVLDGNPVLVSLDDSYLSELVIDLKAHYSGQELFIFGGEFSESRMQSIKNDLGLSDITWLGWSEGIAPNPNKLRELVSEKALLLVVSADDGLIPEVIRRWLTTTKVTIANCMNSRRSVLYALKTVADNSRDAGPFIPLSCQAALDWVRDNCPHLQFIQGFDIDIDILEHLQNRARVAMRIKTDLETLNCYAEESLGGRANSGLHTWARFSGYPMNHLSLMESETTDNNPQFRSARTFQVPKEIDTSGFVYMPAHMKLPGTFPSRPSMHFSVDYLKTFGKVLIGYIGPHLENSQSN